MLMLNRHIISFFAENPAASAVKLLAVLTFSIFPIGVIADAGGGGTDESPLSGSYIISGWSIVRWYLYYWLHLFADYPWVVVVAYIVIVASCIAFFWLLVSMAVSVYLRKRKDKFKREIREKYYDEIGQICSSTTENKPIEEIGRILEYKPQNWKWWQMRVWGNLFADLSYEKGQNLNTTNLQNTMRLVGLYDFVEHSLLQGSYYHKMRIIQLARLTNMELPKSSFTKLVNDRHTTLRRVARMSYMCTASNDSFSFLESSINRDIVLSQWDKMEMHDIFSIRKERGLAMPQFSPLIQNQRSPGTKAFLIRETAFWGDDNEVRSLMDNFDSAYFVIRRSAFASMGISKFAEAEPVMEEVFDKQPEVLKRDILKALLSIDSGKAVTFISNICRSNVSADTKHMALYCLYRYGSTGRELFDRMESEADKKDKPMFEYVKG